MYGIDILIYLLNKLILYCRYSRYTQQTDSILCIIETIECTKQTDSLAPNPCYETGLLFNIISLLQTFNNKLTKWPILALDTRILEYSDGVWDEVGNVKNKRYYHGVSVVNYHQVCL